MVDDADDSEWVSWAEAARITAVPVHVIEWWKRQGRIEHRAEDKMRPTLRRTSVEDFGRWYHERELERADRREAKLAARRAARAAQRPPEPVGYVTTQEEAAATGVSEKTLLSASQAAWCGAGRPSVVGSRRGRCGDRPPTPRGGGCGSGRRQTLDLSS